MIAKLSREIHLWFVMRVSIWVYTLSWVFIYFESYIDTVASEKSREPPVCCIC
jgi:hypothetical protein